MMNPETYIATVVTAAVGVVTAIATASTSIFEISKDYSKKKHDKEVFYMYLRQLQHKFESNKKIFTNMFAIENSDKNLTDVLQIYKGELKDATYELLNAQKYEEDCRKYFAGKDMETIHKYILSITYFLNVIRELLKTEEDQSIQRDTELTINQCRSILKNSISVEARDLFGVKKGEAFESILEQVYKEITKFWKSIEKIFKKKADKEEA